MLTVRQAKAGEHEILTKLAMRSEAHWGYDSDFMETFESIYGVTEAFINIHPTFVMEEKGNIVGFYSILINNQGTSLEYFYIEPAFIGKGYGKLLWNHMVESCKNYGIKEIVFVTSPQAKEFYTRMGAEQTGEVESLVKKGRKIPRLVYRFAY
ncbi:GNAT family N-acetyltransferase [Geosporobacter ferrireducens]|uniref:GNAT family N-acetyltransferase n=1 Tax=Geosporobacter ferrireducens TaxID=1424294 RepID=A0A1D8GKR7_9FIRM|nr:GNAT family N-acetyltransferase [Geosporobacter ferrireducens]AOT71501.1 GNAT family N-acetyltransferase [Geosporobacter ferrireducens]MTI57813.1 GNAT family N-acetyltransferase [Geosporobacter ferrireducens]